MGEVREGSVGSDEPDKKISRREFGGKAIKILGGLAVGGTMGWLLSTILGRGAPAESSQESPEFTRQDEATFLQTLRKYLNLNEPPLSEALKSPDFDNNFKIAHNVSIHPLPRHSAYSLGDSIGLVIAKDDSGKVVEEGLLLKLNDESTIEYNQGKLEEVARKFSKYQPPKWETISANINGQKKYIGIRGEWQQPSDDLPYRRITVTNGSQLEIVFRINPFPK